MRLFVSHATADRDAAESLVRSLEERGIPCWLAVRDIPVGGNYAQEIWRAIDDSSSIVVLMTPQSIRSDHVKREVNLALTQHKPLLPVSISGRSASADDLGGDWKYWLGVVQVAEAETIAHAADLISQQARSTATRSDGAASTPPTDVPADPSRDREDDKRSQPLGTRPFPSRLEAHIRSALIQAAASGTTFQVALERTRRLGASTAETRAVAEQLRAARLLDFAGELEPATRIRLT